MKTITVPNTNIEITVNNADEMFTIFARLHPWMDLRVDDVTYEQSATHGYTRSYFQAKFFAD